MRLMLFAALLAALTLGGMTAETGARGGGGPVEAEPGELTLTASTTRARRENRVIALTNERRREHGCYKDLDYRWSLVKAARNHSERMAKARTLSHRLPGEPGLGTRVTRAGYTGWTALAENIAVGYDQAWQVVRAWMRSRGHRRNILDCTMRHIGVGLVTSNGTRWWTQDFGRKW